MKKKRIELLGLDYYYEKLENGMDIYLIPTYHKKKIATLVSKFGYRHDCFFDYKKWHPIKEGAAHFLEHQMKETEGEGKYDFFAKSGTVSNAGTSPNDTRYYFSGSNNFEENLQYLINSTFSPHFTDKTVEKEKGIILEEIARYESSLSRLKTKTIIESALVKSDLRNFGLGTKESVLSITKEDLYFMHETFYQPSNMFLVVTGGFDPKETIKLIRKIQSSKRKKSFKTKKIKEPNRVNEKDVAVKSHLIKSPRMEMIYKINISKKNISKSLIRKYLSLFIKHKFGRGPDFVNELRKAGIITGFISTDRIVDENHVIVILSAKTNNPKFIEKIKSHISLFDADEDYFLRQKKIILSSYLYMPDSFSKINNMFVGVIKEYDFFNHDVINENKKLNYEEFRKTIELLKFNNYSIIKYEKGIENE